MLLADSPFAPLPAPGPHPAPAELRAYAAGTLGPAEEHRVEAHALDCGRCADVLAGLTMSDPATTERAVAGLRARLQARVGQAGPVPVPARGGRAWPRLAAAAALLGAVAGGIWSWQHYEPAPATARLETTAPAPAPSGAPAPGQAPETAAAEAPAEPLTASADPAEPTTAGPAPSKAPASPRPADYAAGAAAPVPPRRAFGSLAKPAMRPAPEAANHHELTNREAEMATLPEEAADMVVAAPVPAAARTLNQSAAAPVAPVAADTLARTDAARPGRQYAKAKASISASAADNTARVAATPMPAAPAINPAPVGGTVALREYLRREAAAFEPEAGAARLSGLVRLEFTVGADGKVGSLKVVRGLRADYDAEAQRLVCEGPAWQPGVAGGRRAALPVEMTVAF